MTTTALALTLPTPLIPAAAYDGHPERYDTEQAEALFYIPLSKRAAPFFPGGHEPAINDRGQVFVFDNPAQVKAARNIDWPALIAGIDTRRYVSHFRKH